MSALDGARASLVELVRSWDGSPMDADGPVPEEHVAAAERELGVVFPPSYRAFLQSFGTAIVNCRVIYGIPANQVWGDVVMMTQLGSQPVPAHYVKVTEDGGRRGYYLDTSRMNAESECPVVAVEPGKAEYTVAESFIEFLRQAGTPAFAGAGWHGSSGLDGRGQES